MRFVDELTVLDRQFTAEAGKFTALTESEDTDDAIALLGLLQELEFVTDRSRVIGRREFAPTVKGWMRIEELNRSVKSGKQAFVAMWFNDATNNAYDRGIAPAIRNCGYEPVRIDNKEHTNKIDDEIIAEIRRSRFLVADFTCEKSHVRGGVYFEAGFASGLGIPVIWTCAEQSLDDLHFDTRQYNHIVWKDVEELRRALEARIGAVIGDGPLPKLGDRG
jgi:nucleoside 2-deoxyribosyltransferase